LRILGADDFLEEPQPPDEVEEMRRIMRELVDRAAMAGEAIAIDIRPLWDAGPHDAEARAHALMMFADWDREELDAWHRDDAEVVRVWSELHPEPRGDANLPFEMRLPALHGTEGETEDGSDMPGRFLRILQDVVGERKLTFLDFRLVDSVSNLVHFHTDGLDDE